MSELSQSKSLLGQITAPRLISLSENQLRKQIIIPLLSEIGAENVKDMHGRNEEGIDVYFEYYDIFNHRRRFGIQLKKGDINLRTKPNIDAVLTIINQIKLSFSKEIVFIDSKMGKTSFIIDGFYVIISGKATGDAIEYILRERKSFPYIQIIEGNGLLEIIQDRKILQQRFSMITRIS